MTGTLTILGGGTKKYPWDTDNPVSVEEATRAFNTAIRAGGQAFDTTEDPGKRIDRPAEIGEGRETMPEDVTVVPRFAGGR